MLLNDFGGAWICAGERFNMHKTGHSGGISAVAAFYVQESPNSLTA